MIKKDVYTHIAANNIKIVFLLLLFPVVFSVFVFGVIKVTGYFVDPEIYQSLRQELGMVLLSISVLCLILTVVSFAFGDKMMLSFAGAELCPDDKEHLKVYRSVENMAIVAGLPTPKVYLINDESLNAFATGFSPQTASIALTTGLIDKLDNLELDAVIAHEMAHVKNRDIRLNMYIITGIGIVGLVGEILTRSFFDGRRRRNDKQGGILVAIGLAGLILLAFRLLIAPFIHMAISRRQEFQADATGSYFTRNPQALASALMKISEDPRVEALDASQQMASACIFNPFEKIGGLLDTHPPVSERIKRLNEMS